MKEPLWSPPQDVIIVTRHEELRQYLVEIGYIAHDADTISHAVVSDIKGRHVIGKIPLALAAHCRSVTEIPMRLEESDRGKVISLRRLREVALSPQVFEVHRIA